MEDGRLAALKVMRLDDSSAIACAAEEAANLAAGLDCCLTLEVCIPGSRIEAFSMALSNHPKGFDAQV